MIDFGIRPPRGEFSRTRFSKGSKPDSQQLTPWLDCGCQLQLRPWMMLRLHKFHEKSSFDLFRFYTSISESSGCLVAIMGLVGWSVLTVTPPKLQMDSLYMR